MRGLALLAPRCLALRTDKEEVLVGTNQVGKVKLPPPHVDTHTRTHKMTHAHTI